MMKKLIFRNLKSCAISALKALVLLVLGLYFNSCKPEKPINNIEEKGHDEAWEVKFKFTPCNVGSIEGIFANGLETKEGKESIVYYVKRNEDTGEIINGEAIFLEKGEKYKLDIEFLNKHGELLNEQFLSPEQAQMHQFFFMSNRKSKIKPYPTSIPVQFDYKYADKFKDGETKQPIGFEGLFSLKDDLDYNTFNVRAILVHITPPVSKKNESGNYYGFNEPATHLLGSNDLDINIPIRVKGTEDDSDKVVKPAYIDVLMKQVHSHGTYYHGNPSYLDHEYPLKGEYKIKFKYDDNTGKYTLLPEVNGENTGSGSSIQKVKMLADTRWAIEIVVYDSKNNRINSNYAEGEAQDVNQFFVTVENNSSYDPNNIGGSSTGGVKPREIVAAETDNFKDLISSAEYRDTDPENKMLKKDSGVKLNNKSIGFKSCIQFNVKKYVEFDVRYRLVQFKIKTEKEIVDEDGDKGYRSAYEWESSFADKVLFDFSIPIKLISKRPYNTADTEQKNKDLAKEFNISYEEMVKLDKSRLDVPAESSNYYM